MKKVLAIAVMLLLASTLAMASATNWMLYIQTDSTSGEDFGSKAQLGVKPAGLDDYDALDSIPIDFGTTMPSTKWAGFPISGEVGNPNQPDLYNRSYKAPVADPAVAGKAWAFRVAGLSSAVGPIRMQFQTGTNTALFPVAPGAGWGYFIKLVANKNQPVVRPAWAPNAGAPWVPGDAIALPALPTAKSAYFGEILLPQLNISPNTNATMIANGYEFEFVEGPTAPVPEPSSLLAIGTGLIGLMGFVSRKRRV